MLATHLHRQLGFGVGGEEPGDEEGIAGEGAMFFSRKKTAVSEALPERLGYSRYYEHDGQLRAYANRRC